MKVRVAVSSTLHASSDDVGPTAVTSTGSHCQVSTCDAGEMRDVLTRDVGLTRQGKVIDDQVCSEIHDHVTAAQVALSHVKSANSSPKSVTKLELKQESRIS